MDRLVKNYEQELANILLKQDRKTNSQYDIKLKEIKNLKKIY